MTRYELNKQIDEVIDAIDDIPNAIHMEEILEPIKNKLDRIRSRLMSEELQG